MLLNSIFIYIKNNISFKNKEMFIFRDTHECHNVVRLRYSPLKIEEFDEEGLVTSEQPTFFRLMIAIYLALMSHSDMVCYFAVFILQIRNPSILSLPLPLMVFLWGTLSMPRPTKTFWVTMIAYTEVILYI